MKKRLSVIAVAFGLFLGLSVPVGAVALHPNQVNTFCDDGYLSLHFVHNQLAGQGNTLGPGATITIVMSALPNGGGGTTTIVAAPSTQWNNGTVHYTVVGLSGGYPYLWSANDTIGIGKLVLSDASCKKKGADPVFP